MWWDDSNLFINIKTIIILILIASLIVIVRYITFLIVPFFHSVTKKLSWKLWNLLYYILEQNRVPIPLPMQTDGHIMSCTFLSGWTLSTRCLQNLRIQLTYCVCQQSTKQSQYIQCHCHHHFFHHVSFNINISILLGTAIVMMTPLLVVRHHYTTPTTTNLILKPIFLPTSKFWIHLSGFLSHALWRMHNMPCRCLPSYRGNNNGKSSITYNHNNAC